LLGFILEIFVSKVVLWLIGSMSMFSPATTNMQVILDS